MSRITEVRYWLNITSAGLSLVGLIVVVFVARIVASDGFAYDAHAYWFADGYGRLEDTQDAFVYPPPSLLLSRAFGLLPWQVFLELYTVAIAVGVWILAGPFSTILVFTPQVASELTLANVHVFLALVAVFGLRWPALWAITLLTKVTPGVGLLWFVFRGEWRKLAIALGVTTAIALPTVILAPDLWLQWIALLRDSAQRSDGGPLALRLPIAVLILFVGARRDWPWVVPIACMLGLPVLWSIHGLSMLLGLVWYARLGLPAWHHALENAVRGIDKIVVRGIDKPPGPKTGRFE